jgi:hypothetical protein
MDMITWPIKLRVLLFIAGCFLIQAGFAQETEPVTGESEADTAEAPSAGETEGASHETEFNDDNYRRFMELRQGRNERDALPDAAFETEPSPSLEKIQSLPEASQKHLRNELRDKIVEGEKWTPEQLDADYAYSPSEAAQTNDGLKQQESEAWDELVSEYHAREADIYAHSARSQVASAAGSAGSNAQSGQQGEGASSGSTSSNSQDASTEKSVGQPARTAVSSNESVDEQSDRLDTRGVSQNALEFLIASGDAAPTPGRKQDDADAEANENSTVQGEAELIVVPGTLSIEELSHAQGVVEPEEPEDDEANDGN